MSKRESVYRKRHVNVIDFPQLHLKPFPRCMSVVIVSGPHSTSEEAMVYLGIMPKLLYGKRKA